MRAALAELRQAAAVAVTACASPDELEAVQIQFLGRKGSLNGILRGLGQLPADERPAMGALANQVKDEIMAALGERQRVLSVALMARALETERVDVTMPGRQRPVGHIHPLRAVEEEVVEIFLSMGFSVADGPEIEDDFHNFGALNFEPDHPARDMHDTFYVDAGDDALLRTHTSPVQTRTMRTHQPPLRFIAPGTCFRRDDPDPTHSPMFQQLEGFMVDEQVSLANLKGVLVHFLQRLYGAETRVRFRPSFFPFTEPSAEVDFSCFRCGGKGGVCRLCKGTGWVEILGCGMIHPNVLRSVGYDPERLQGFAFGLGIDRIAQIRYGIEDLRLFYEGDLRFLEQFPG